MIGGDRLFGIVYYRIYEEFAELHSGYFNVWVDASFCETQMLDFNCLADGNRFIRCYLGTGLLMLYAWQISATHEGLHRFYLNHYFERGIHLTSQKCLQAKKVDVSCDSSCCLLSLVLYERK